MPDHQPDAAPTRWARLRAAANRAVRSVRSRVLVALVVLTALTLTVTGILDYVVDRQRHADQVNESLSRTYAEVVELAENGVDPATGEPFANVDALLRIALQRSVGAPDEGFLGILGTKVRWLAPESVALRLEDDPELVAIAIERSIESDGAFRETVRTSMREYRLLVLPVASSDVDRGALVVAFDESTAHAELAAQHLWRFVIGIGVLAGAALITWIALGRILRPLAVARRTADEITGRDLSRRIPVEGDDDLAALIGTLNGMLDRLEQAFDGQRELLDDVGHELRTPLTIVQGHLELMDADDPADIAETRELVLDELERMGRLVEDLIIIAKASRPDFVRRRDVDLGELLDTVLLKAATLGDRDWRLEARPEAAVRLDPQRITQALLQLIGNAVTHSEPGSTIGLGGRVDRGRGEVRLWVRDEGTGIPEDARRRIFERFEQASGMRAPGGSNAPLIGMGLGIGLSIVAAIARGHGGAARVDSRVGEGSRFELVLPLEPALPPLPPPGAAAPGAGVRQDRGDGPSDDGGTGA